MPVADLKLTAPKLTAVQHHEHMAFWWQVQICALIAMRSMTGPAHQTMAETLLNGQSPLLSAALGHKRDPANQGVSGSAITALQCTARTTRES